MATMSIRGLDDQVLARLKKKAIQEGTSLNSWVLALLQGNPVHQGSLGKFDDLEGLSGIWSEEKVKAFERNTAAFAEIDPALWN